MSATNLGQYPASPVDHKNRFADSEWNGLTKREYIAIHLLNGLLAQRKVQHRSFKNLARTAIAHADELLTQLGEAPV